MTEPIGGTPDSEEIRLPRPRVGGQPLPERAVGAPAVQLGLADALGLHPAAEAAIRDDLTERERDAVSLAAAAARDGLAGPDELIIDQD